MKFGEIATNEAEGCYLAHSLKHGDLRFKKGHLLAEADIAALRAAGILRVIVARLEAGDLHEGEAARRIGMSVAGGGVYTEPPFTGRVNLFASESGVMVVDEERVNALNRLHPAITFASLANYTTVEKGRMVATVKIIPFAAPEAAVAAAEALGTMIEVKSFVSKNVVLVATMLDTLKPATMDKTRQVLEARLEAGKAQLMREIRVAHTQEAVQAGLLEAIQEKLDLIVLFGASATVDIQDVAPAGLTAAGGELHHFGMPVDPGNLLFLGRLNNIPVIGAPGCARSPADNGFDWILNRLLADIPVSREDIMGLGVGGLLMEIVSRPQPRASRLHDRDKISAIVLAAGRSTRMGGANKLLAMLEGKPLVRHVVCALLEGDFHEVIVVTGHMADAVEKALTGLEVYFIHNPDFAEGLSTSLRAGVNAVDEQADAALIALGDMPFVATEAFNRLIEAYRTREDIYAVVATSNGKRGNPVLWSRRFFDDLKSIHGDTGARHLIGANEAVIGEVEIGTAAALDLDTPQALGAVGGIIDGA